MFASTQKSSILAAALAAALVPEVAAKKGAKIPQLLDAVKELKKENDGLKAEVDELRWALMQTMDVVLSKSEKERLVDNGVDLKNIEEARALFFYQGDGEESTDVDSDKAENKSDDSAVSKTEVEDEPEPEEETEEETEKKPEMPDLSDLMGKMMGGKKGKGGMPNLGNLASLMGGMDMEKLMKGMDMEKVNKMMAGMDMGKMAKMMEGMDPAQMAQMAKMAGVMGNGNSDDDEVDAEDIHVEL